METAKNIYGRTIKINGRNVHYYPGGRGEPLVVVHGGLGDARTWIENVSRSADDYTVYIPDLLGFVESQL